MQFPLLFVSVTLAVAGVRGLIAVDKRQSPLDVPAACSSTCQPVVNETDAGCPQSQCCTDTFLTEYYNCFKCIGSNLPYYDYAPSQIALNQLWQACEIAGYSLSPPQALPGQSAPTGNEDASTPAQPAPTSTVTVSGNATASGTSGSQPTNGAAREAEVHVREVFGLALIWLVHQML